VFAFTYLSFTGTGMLIAAIICGFERDPTEGFRFVSDHQTAYPTTRMCELLGVSSSAYYAWIKRCPSQRAGTDVTLIAERARVHDHRIRCS
jgi:hypothetical protein